MATLAVKFYSADTNLVNFFSKNYDATHIKHACKDDYSWLMGTKGLLPNTHFQNLVFVLGMGENQREASQRGRKSSTRGKKESRHKESQED